MPIAEGRKSACHLLRRSKLKQIFFQIKLESILNEEISSSRAHLFISWTERPNIQRRTVKISVFTNYYKLIYLGLKKPEIKKLFLKTDFFHNNFFNEFHQKRNLFTAIWWTRVETCTEVKPIKNTYSGWLYVTNLYYWPNHSLQTEKLEEVLAPRSVVQCWEILNAKWRKKGKLWVSYAARHKGGPR